jgi:hypothetical protein
MHKIVRVAASVGVGLCLGYTLSFLLSPDPTGTAPLVLGLVLTGLLTPGVYYGLGRAVSK